MKSNLLRLRALVDFIRDGALIHAGEAFVVDAREAELLLKWGRARLTAQAHKRLCGSADPWIHPTTR